jgi:hypothetical protein
MFKRIGNTKLALRSGRCPTEPVNQYVKEKSYVNFERRTLFSLAF